MFNRESKEYIDNGHYRVDDIEFMSIWAFKNNNSLPNNITEINAEEALRLGNIEGVVIHTCVPDFGNFEIINIYPIDELKRFYKI